MPPTWIFSNLTLRKQGFKKLSHKKHVLSKHVFFPVLSGYIIYLLILTFFCFCLDCILLGSMFWGLWRQRNNSSYYYKAFISRINITHIEFILQFNNNLKRTYNRTDPVLIINSFPKKWEISVNAPVIAVHNPDVSDWYQTGTVKNKSEKGKFVNVKFDDGSSRLVLLKEIRLVKRPRFC